MYCNRIQKAHVRFGGTYSAFAEDDDYRDAVCMSVLQIGELAGRLSNDLRHETFHIPWKLIRGIRNVIVHQYYTADLPKLWVAVDEGIPQLLSDCESILQAEGENP